MPFPWQDPKVVGEGEHEQYAHRIRLNEHSKDFRDESGAALFYVRKVDGVQRLFYRDEDGVEREIAPGDILGLSDTPSSYTGQTLRFVRVKVNEDGLEFVVHGSSGDPHSQYAFADDLVTHEGFMDVHHAAVHLLGSADHSADTLAALNALVSDATLDDSGASRPAQTHNLGGAEHGADTLANLNAKVSDATLDDSGDSRPPSGAAGGDLSGTYPNPTVAVSSPHTYVFVPDAAKGIDVSVGDGQGIHHHSLDNAETVVAWYIDAETAPTGAGLIVQLEYGDTDDLDTVASWTEIDRDTLPAGSKSVKFTTGFTNSSIPADRLIRANIDQVGSTVAGQDVGVHLYVKRPLVT